MSDRGFEALRLSLHGALRVFGVEAAYVVYVNSMSLETARARTGAVPERVEWRLAPNTAPAVLRGRLSAAMAEGVAWKLMPLRAFAGAYELALDNDVILWAAPPAMRRWLEDGSQATLLAEDVTPANGVFADLCGPHPRNSGIRGLPPGFDLAAAMERVLRKKPAALDSELDEQGLQIAALSQDAEPLVVGVEEVTICSPFPPHLPHLGRSGAHFVGLNARQIPWRYYDRPATEVRIEHWERRRPELYARVGLPLPAV